MVATLRSSWTASTDATMSGIGSALLTESGGYWISSIGDDVAYSSDEGASWTVGASDTGGNGNHCRIQVDGTGVGRVQELPSTGYFLQTTGSPPTAFTLDEQISGLGGALFSEAGGATYVSRSTDKVIFRQGDNGRVMGADYARVVYQRRTGASTYTAATVVCPEDEKHYYCATAFGVGERVHFLFVERLGTTAYLRTLSASNVLSTTSSVGVSYGNTYPSPDVVTIGSTVFIGAMFTGGVGFGVIKFTSADSPTISTETAASAAVINPNTNINLAHDPVTNDLYLVTGDFDDGNVKYVRRDGTTGLWDTPVVYLASSVSLCGARVFSKGSGARVLGVVVRDGTGLDYYELEIAAGSMPNGAGSGAFAWTATTSGTRPPEPVHQGSATGAMAWSGSTDGASDPNYVQAFFSWTANASGARASAGLASATVAWSGFAGDGSFDGSWEIVTSLPETRHQAAAAADGDGLIYVFGGYVNGVVGTGNETGSVVRYDPAADSWTTIGSISARRSLAGATDNLGRVYALGGIQSVTKKATVQRFDPAQGSWSTLSNMPLARQGFSAVGDSQGYIYVLGGQSDDATELGRYAARLNTTTDQWEVLPKMPAGMGTAGAGCDQYDRIYVFAGSGGTDDNVYRYDPTLNQWFVLPSLPTGRDTPGGAVDDQGRMYAIGGDLIASGGSETAVVERYDPGDSTWTTLDPISVARYQLCSATDNSGQVYAIGGWDGTTQYDIVERYTAVSTRATGGEGYDEFAWAGTTATGTNLPPPRNIVATPISDTQIDLSWDPVGSATGYDIERDGVVAVTNHQTTSYSDTGLTVLTQYDYRIRSRRI